MILIITLVFKSNLKLRNMVVIYVETSVTKNKLKYLESDLCCAVQLVVLTRCSGFRQLSAKEMGRLRFLQ